MREVKVSLVITSASLRLSEISAKVGRAHSSGSHDRGTSSLPGGKPFNETIWRMDSTEPESAPLEKHFANIGSQIPAKSITDSGLLAGNARCFFDIAVFFDDAMCSIDIPKICLKAIERYGAEISIACYPVDDKLGSQK